MTDVKHTAIEWSAWDAEIDAKGAETPFGSYRVTAAFEDTGDYWGAWRDGTLLGFFDCEMHATDWAEGDYRDRLAKASGETP